MKANKGLVISIILVIMVVAGFVLYYSERERPFSPEIEAKLDQLMADTMKKYNAPGMTMGIWVPGKGSFVRAKGVADLATGRKMDTRDIFRIGSLTKTFTATVILQLVDEGKVRLDDSLHKFYPKVPNSRNITVRQLLNMTSGIHSYTELEWVQKAFFTDRFRAWSPAELVKAAIAVKPDFPPGKGFHYSNTNYVLLGIIIEKITGNKLEDEIQRRIVDRLRLSHTVFPTGPEIGEGAIHGYMYDNGKPDDWTRDNVSWGWAAGAMISNMYDLKTYIKAINDGTFLSKKLQEERLSSWVDMELAHKEIMTTLKYGLGVFTAGGFVGHNGGLPGYVNLAMYHPESGARVLFMLNTQPEGPATLMIFKKVHQILFPGAKI
jgi:D-alanyl-D-alanine carboxypeptidase